MMKTKKLRVGMLLIVMALLLVFSVSALNNKPIAGRVYYINGDTAVVGADVWVHVQTNDEMCTAGPVKTAADGSYTLDLFNLKSDDDSSSCEDDWEELDRMYVEVDASWVIGGSIRYYTDNTTVPNNGGSAYVFNNIVIPQVPEDDDDEEEAPQQDDYSPAGGGGGGGGGGGSSSLLAALSRSQSGDSGADAASADSGSDSAGDSSGSSGSGSIGSGDTASEAGSMASMEASLSDTGSIDSAATGWAIGNFASMVFTSKSFAFFGLIMLILFVSTTTLFLVKPVYKVKFFTMARDKTRRVRHGSRYYGVRTYNATKNALSTAAEKMRLSKVIAKVSSIVSLAAIANLIGIKRDRAEVEEEKYIEVKNKCKVRKDDHDDDDYGDDDEDDNDYGDDDVNSSSSKGSIYDRLIARKFKTDKDVRVTDDGVKEIRLIMDEPKHKQKKSHSRKIQDKFKLKYDLVKDALKPKKMTKNHIEKIMVDHGRLPNRRVRKIYHFKKDNKKKRK